jgi:hypothetical protein
VRRRAKSRVAATIVNASDPSSKHQKSRTLQKRSTRLQLKHLHPKPQKRRPQTGRQKSAVAADVEVADVVMVPKAVRTHRLLKTLWQRRQTTTLKSQRRRMTSKRLDTARQRNEPKVVVVDAEGLNQNLRW